MRGFCACCGTPLSFAYQASEHMDLSVGSLDEPAAVTLISHFAVESRVANWHADDGLPGERLGEHVALAQRWQAASGATVVPGVGASRER